MIGPIVKSAIGDEDISGSPLLLAPALLVLLGSNHNEGELPSGLPNLILLGDLFCICRRITSPLIVARFGLLGIVDFVAVVMSTAVHGFVLLLPFGDGPFG